MLTPKVTDRTCSTVGLFTQPLLISESGIVVGCSWMECHRVQLVGAGYGYFFLISDGVVVVVVWFFFN